MMTARAFLAIAAILAAVSARAETVRVTPDDCRNAVAHQPDGDVSFRPGVDVDGQPVEPADLHESPRLAMPQEIVIDITVLLQPRLGIPADPSRYQGEARIGLLTWRDGQGWFNGQTLMPESQAALIAACREALRRR